MQAKPVKDQPETHKKANEPRKHHYVPVFYQKHFANSGELLWVYDRKLGTYKELHPNVICFERDLYAVKPEDGSRDQHLESQYLARIDALGASGIDGLRAGEQPSALVRQAIAFFAAHQFSRLPSTGRGISSLRVKGAEELSRIIFANVDRAKYFLDKHARETGASLDVSPESMVESVRGDQYAISATEMPFLQNMLNLGSSLSKWITRSNWQILVVPPETGFILCDSPVTFVPPKGVAEVGFDVPGTVKYFPLTRSLCLRLDATGSFFEYRSIDRETARIINQNVAANSERFIMGPAKRQLENIVTRSASTKLDSTPRFTVETVEKDSDSALLKIKFNPRRYFYAKSDSSQAP